MNRTRTLRIAGMVVVGLLLAACGGGGGGGGGGDSSPTSPTPQNPSPSPNTPQLPNPSTAPALRDVFAESFPIGAAIEPEQLDDDRDRALLLKHYSSLTAENAMKPSTIAPNDPYAVGSDGFQFQRGDRIVDFAVSNGMQVHGHTLVWHQTAPDWFFAGDRNDPSYRAIVQQRLVAYITEVVTYYKGRVSSWDVVNEVASDLDGETFRVNSPWYQAFSANGGDGREYVRIAFKAARAADPNARLFINDYSTENPAKLAKVLAIIDYIEETDEVTVDGVGHQMHLQRTAQVADVEAALKTVANRGKANRITELDVSIYADPGECFVLQRIPPCAANYGASFADVPQSAVSQQAQLYRDLFALFREYSLDAVTTWGIHDAHTWLNGWPVSRTNWPLLFDRDRNPKLAFWAVVDPEFAIP